MLRRRFSSSGLTVSRSAVIWLNDATSVPNSSSGAICVRRRADTVLPVALRDLARSLGELLDRHRDAFGEDRTPSRWRRRSRPASPAPASRCTCSGDRLLQDLQLAVLLERARDVSALRVATLSARSTRRRRRRRPCRGRRSARRPRMTSPSPIDWMRVMPWRAAIRSNDSASGATVSRSSPLDTATADLAAGGRPEPSRDRGTRAASRRSVRARRVSRGRASRGCRSPQRSPASGTASRWPSPGSTPAPPRATPRASSRPGR